MKALYANRRPYADWLKTNTVTIGEVVATAPSAMAPQLLGVPATSSVHPDPKTLASNSYSSASNGWVSCRCCDCVPFVHLRASGRFYCVCVGACCVLGSHTHSRLLAAFYLRASPATALL